MVTNQIGVDADFDGNEYERIRIAWDRGRRLGSTVFDGRMDIPCPMSLKEDKDGYSLCAERSYKGCEPA